MQKVSVRRANEWDGPAMLKIYAPYTGTRFSLESEPPALQSFISRIDTYTYGLGWLICEIDSVPAGFCHLREDRDEPKNLFSVEFELYVKPAFFRRGVGTALWSLMRDMMELGSRKKVSAYVNKENLAARAFFDAIAFKLESESAGVLRYVYPLNPLDPSAQRPVKPYLLENVDYEKARIRAAGIVRQGEG